MPQVTSQWSLLMGVPLGMPLSLLLAALLLAFALRDTRQILARLSGRPRVLVLSTRALTALLGLALIFQPQWLSERMQLGEGKVAVLMDVSRSMALPGQSGSRTDEAVRALKSVTDALPAASVFMFGSEVRPGDVEGIVAQYPVTDDETDIFAGLSGALEAVGQGVGAIVVISDGADSDAGQALSKAALQQLGTRVHTVVVGGKGPTVDDRITSVRADPVAFLRQQAEVEVTLERTPGTSSQLPVSLRKDGALVAEVMADIDAAGHGRVVLPFDVTQLGRAVYTVSIPVADADVIPQNNERAFLIRVTRDRLRVLLVGGRPGWDSHFLRTFLKSRPSIDLITFFILRTASDMSMASPDELSLIPFPTDELFREHLHSFDLVIFQDFNYGPYQMARYLPRVREFVLQGGAFAMVGGDLSFSSGGYAETPIAEILPVDLPTHEPLVSLQAFKPSLAPAMQSHPLIELLPERSDNQQLWSRFAASQGANVLGAPREGSSVLLQHPTDTLPDGSPRPILVTGESGEGRTMALAIDSSYRWGFATAGRSGDPSGYERFWDRALRYLTRDPSLEPAQVRTERERYGPGAKLEAEFLARARNYAMVPDAQLALAITSDGDVLSQVAVRADGNGRGTASMQAPQAAGAYSIELRIDGEVAAEEAFVVEMGGAEYERPFPDVALMRRLAERSGGSYFEGSIPEPENLERSHARHLGTDRISPLSHWLFLFILSAALLADWVLRRRYGLR